MILALLGCADDFDREAWGIPDHYPSPIVPEDNPLTPEKVELGRHLFYDFRLSVNGKRSCGICHEPQKGFTDGFVRALGAYDDPHPRNTLTITDVAWREQFGWRSLVPSDLEHQLLVPLTGDFPVLEMGMTEDLLVERLEATSLYPPLFDAAFPGEAISLENAGKAIASFERTMISGTSPYDEHLLGGDLPPDAERGRQLFFGNEARCSRCHGGLWLDSPTSRWGRVTARHGWFNTGLYDIDGEGSYPAIEQGLFAETGLIEDMGRFRTPSLRNVALTGPWTHDGSVSDLGDLLDAYARGGRDVQSGPNPGDGAENPHKSPLVSGFDMSMQDRDDLLAFLEALTDTRMVEDPALQNPFCVEVGGEIVNEPCLEPEPF